VEVGDIVNYEDSGSFDPDGTIVSYEWDSENDGTVDFFSPGTWRRISYLH
jgi:hypothetical protein